MAAPLVGLIMGSRSDWETMRHAAETLDELGVPFEQRVVSAHRTPDLLFEYASSAEERGLRVLIAGAGGAAHLPGMAASKTTLPVLGVPVESKALSGMDSLLSIVQMPAGVPVGTLAIGRAGAVNAALLAAAILAGSDAALADRLRRFRAAQTEAVLDSPDPAIPRREPSRACNRLLQAMTTVACIGGGQLGRMLGLAGLPLGLSFRFLDPSPDACAREVGELVVGEYGDPEALDRLVDGADVVTYEFENVPVEAASRVAAVPGPGRARAGAGPPAREGALPVARDRDGAVRHARGDGAAGARQVEAARLRRQGPAAGRRGGRGRRRTSSRRSSCRSTGSSRSSACGGGTARRGSGRSARTSIATGSCG